MTYGKLEHIENLPNNFWNKSPLISGFPSKWRAAYSDLLLDGQTYFDWHNILWVDIRLKDKHFLSLVRLNPSSLWLSSSQPKFLDFFLFSGYWPSKKSRKGELFLLESKVKVLLDLKEKQGRGKAFVAQFRCCNKEGEFEGDAENKREEEERGGVQELEVSFSFHLS
jgi:hypothetical protein